MKSPFLDIRLYRFFTLNFLMVAAFEFLLLPNNDMFLMMVAVTIPIILIQYPILNIRINWYYRSLIFYLSMLTFLFAFGLIFSWNEKVGSNEAGSLLARLDGAFRITFFGHIYGTGALVFIILVNWLTTKWTLRHGFPNGLICF